MNTKQLEKLKKIMYRPRPGWMSRIDRGDPRLLHCDEDFLVFNKPSAISTVREHECDKAQDMFSVAKLYLETKTGEPKNYLGVIHKLDKFASGILVFSRNPDFTRGVNMLLRRREVKKTYFAIVSGKLLNKGMLQHRIWKDDETKRMFCFDMDETPALPSTAALQDCELQYEPIFQFGDKKRGHISCVKIRMGSGRKHQIRAQFSKLGYPILGDFKYGDKRPFLKNSIALHALTFNFYHPLTGKPNHLYANLPLSWLEIFPKNVLEMLVREHWGYDFVHAGEAHKIADVDFNAPTWGQYAPGAVKATKSQVVSRKGKRRPNS